MSHYSHLGHMLHGAEKDIHGMKPLKKRKNAFIAFVLGVLFGCFGVGLYLWSWKDFFYSLLIVLAFVTMFLPTGPLEVLSLPLGFLVVGGYAAYRVNSSNSHLSH